MTSAAVLVLAMRDDSHRCREMIALRAALEDDSDADAIAALSWRWHGSTAWRWWRGRGDTGASRILAELGCDDSRVSSSRRSRLRGATRALERAPSMGEAEAISPPGTDDSPRSNTPRSDRNHLAPPAGLEPATHV